MKTKKYVIDLSPRSRIHIDFKREKKKILDFAVNFEIITKKKWVSTLRYDTSHDHCKNLKWKYPHKHILHNKKRETLVPIRTDDYNYALTLAIKDIRNNFKKIKYRFFN